MFVTTFQCSPFFGEEFGFLVPRDFRQLSFYVMVSDSLPLSRDIKLGKVAIDKDVLVKVWGNVFVCVCVLNVC